MKVVDVQQPNEIEAILRSLSIRISSISTAAENVINTVEHDGGGH